MASVHGTNRTLPDYQVLRAEFSRGATLKQLAKKYKSNPTSINRKMRDMSKHFGDPWPMVVYGSEEWRRRLVAANKRKNALELCDPSVIRDYIAAYLRLSGTSQRGFATECGVAFSTINCLVNAKRKYLNRVTAKQITDTLERLGAFEMVDEAA